MESAPTIIAELEDYIKGQALTISKFAGLSGMNSGTLSNVINGHRPIAVQQLDRITETMGQTEGYFYDLYIDNYIINAAADWRRISPLLKRCAELGKLGSLERVVQHIMDNLIYLPLLFDMAEELFHQDRLAAAAIIYASVAEGERLQHSERLALCKYRLFILGLSDNQEANLHAANQFEPYVERLDEADQLDALKHLADVFASLHRWDKTEELAERLGSKARLQYKYLKKAAYKQPVRPLIYYILYAYLIQAGVSDERGDYAKALHYTSLYANMDWIKAGPSAEEQRVMDLFKEWATANTYLYRVMDGQADVLPEYVQYVESRENEIFPALFKIIQAANRYRFNVDDILERFHSYISFRQQHSTLGRYNLQLTNDRYANFSIELAVYHLRANRLDTGLDYLLESLDMAVNIKSDSCIVRCVALFEKYRISASPRHIELYTNRISEVQRINEEKYNCIRVNG
ncbi:transcriptional regulator [Paenibacillus sp. PK3_47]|nr:transcriptional regulator [Paenibacillus sp. PK3_47]